MDSKTYATQLEKRLIEQFKENFFEKLGYYPTVITKCQDSTTDWYIPIMSLQSLLDYFEPYLPEQYGKTLQLTDMSRHRPIVELRNIYCMLARQMGYSLVIIGEAIGKRDHTTVIHNITSCKNLLETNDAFRDKYIQILKYIKQQHESPIMDEPCQIQCESEPALLP